MKKSGLIGYKHICRQRECYNYVEKKDDLCDTCLLHKNGLYAFPANALDEATDYITAESVLKVIRKSDRKLRNK